MRALYYCGAQLPEAAFPQGTIALIHLDRVRGYVASFGRTAR